MSEKCKKCGKDKRELHGYIIYCNDRSCYNPLTVKEYASMIRREALDECYKIVGKLLLESETKAEEMRLLKIMKSIRKLKEEG